MNFEELGIDPRFLRALNAQRITEPTPIQAQAIPAALEGRDLVAIAQTGTGKTLAFGLPALSRLAEQNGGRNRMLVLTPTRELAQQVHGVLSSLGKPLGLHAVCLYGGAGMDAQTQALRRGCAIVVATPGRLLDHLERRNVRFKDLSILVLDEADRMLDMGFMPDIQRILSQVPEERQTLMFSATFPEEIARLAREMQREPVRIEVGAVAMPADAVRQGVYTVNPNAKLDLLSKILEQPEVLSALVFIRTKHRTDRIAKALHQAGFKAQAIHGGRTQRQRQLAIDGFRKGRYTVLVATDVAARGLDVHGITHVVNFDIPNCPDDYIHRIGRTARANATGDAITFVSPQDCGALGAIERALGKNIPREEWEGSVPVASRFRSNSASGKSGRPAGNRPEKKNAPRPERPKQAKRVPAEMPEESPEPEMKAAPEPRAERPGKKYVSKAPYPRNDRPGKRPQTRGKAQHGRAPYRPEKAEARREEGSHPRFEKAEKRNEQNTQFRAEDTGAEREERTPRRPASPSAKREGRAPHRPGKPGEKRDGRAPHRSGKPDEKREGRAPYRPGKPDAKREGYAPRRPENAETRHEDRDQRPARRGEEREGYAARRSENESSRREEHAEGRGRKPSGARGGFPRNKGRNPASRGRRVTRTREDRG